MSKLADLMTIRDNIDERLDDFRLLQKWEILGEDEEEYMEAFTTYRKRLNEEIVELCQCEIAHIRLEVL